MRVVRRMVLQKGLVGTWKEKDIFPLREVPCFVILGYYAVEIDPCCPARFTVYDRLSDRSSCGEARMPSGQECFKNVRRVLSLV